MITPPLISTNDAIAVIAPSGRVVVEKTNSGIQILEDKGFDIQKGKNLYASYFRFAGTEKQRLDDLQWALNNPEINAIFCARGGYGITKIIDLLDFSEFLKHPKWIIGFSDITALLIHVYKLGVQSIHGPMPNSFGGTTFEHVEECLSILYHEQKKSIVFKKESENREGTAEGTLIGGNLSILAHIIGSASQPDFSEKILFLEDLNEEMYHTDRMLVQLKRAGAFDSLAGLMIGNFSGMKDSAKDPFGKSIYQMIDEYVPKNIPIASGLPVGHEKENHPLIVGAKARLTVEKNSTVINYL